MRAGTCMLFFVTYYSNYTNSLSSACLNYQNSASLHGLRSDFLILCLSTEDIFKTKLGG